MENLTNKELLEITGGTDGVSDATEWLIETIAWGICGVINTAEAVGEFLEDVACGVSRYGC